MEMVQLLTNFSLSEAGLKPETESFPALPASCLLESVHEPQLWLWALGFLAALHRQQQGDGGVGQRAACPILLCLAAPACFRYATKSKALGWLKQTELVVN